MEIRTLRADDTATVVGILTAGETDMRKHLISASISGALSNPAAQSIGLVGVCHSQVVGAVIASVLQGGTAILSGLRIDCEQPPEVAQALFDALQQRLHRLGTVFLQATCDWESPPVELVVNHFKHLADLQYLSIETQALQVDEIAELSFVGADTLNDQQLCHLVSETYRHSKDCPAMSQYRSVEETLRSYRAAPNHDPTTWRIAIHQGEAVGCVLMLPFPESSTLELTYMGIADAWRGKGWGAALVGETRRVADERNLKDISLGVDCDNEPAQRIYSNYGFTAFFRESVWGRRIVPPE